MVDSCSEVGVWRENDFVAVLIFILQMQVNTKQIRMRKLFHKKEDAKSIELFWTNQNLRQVISGNVTAESLKDASD